MKPRPILSWLVAVTILPVLPLRATDPAPAAASDSGMTTYYFCLLTKGPNRGQTPAEAQKLQAGHMANIGRLAAEGKLLVAGPFADDGDWRGLFIFKCASLEEAQALVAADPAIAAGRLKAEIRPWLTAKGYIRDPEFPMAGAGSTPP
jgi:uncharacterized protein